MNKTPRASAAYPGTQAVLRAIGLLKAFTPERPERGLVDLAQAVSLNRTTAYRLLTALASEGLVERSGEAYRLGPELLALGARAQGTGELRAAARAELDALATETRETVTLEVLAGRDTLILDEAMGNHVLGTTPSVGTRWPAHATSTGKVLLAHVEDGVLAAFLEEPLAAPTPRTFSDPPAFRRELARVRERGYAVSAEELEAGFVAVGVPIRSASSDVVAALSVGGPRMRLTAQRVSALGARLPAAALRISERLGFRRDLTAQATRPAAPRQNRGKKR